LTDINHTDHKMKYAAVSILLLVMSVVVFRLLQPEPIHTASMDTASPVDTSALVEENAEVFRRIFWRQPGEADKIIQSQRRERVSGEGAPTEWDWFLAVDPSAEFADYLFEENPFQLTISTDEVDLTGTTDWFPQSTHGYEIRRSLTGEMTLLINPKTRRIYAWNQARAFRPAIQLPDEPTSTSPNRNAGRLPPTSPPNPE
jgi:hypothetical protein